MKKLYEQHRELDLSDTAKKTQCVGRDRALIIIQRSSKHNLTSSTDFLCRSLMKSINYEHQ